MRLSRLIALVSVLFGLISPSLPAHAASDEPWVFEGGGWGHGVGLSQFGSEGMARDNWTMEQIINYYYSGAEVKTLDEVGAPPWLGNAEAIWVGLASSQTSATFEAIGDGLAVCQRRNGSDSCDVTLNKGDHLTIKVVATSPLQCSVSVNGGLVTVGDCWVDIPLQASTPLLQYGSQQYARGTLRIRQNSHDEGAGTKFHVSVSVGLEHYIYGISETILSFRPAALETQAVIARSYGVRKTLDAATDTGELKNGRKDSCWCHVSASPAVDQNYDGWDVDNEGHNTLGETWRAAGDDTASKIVTHPQVSGGTKIIPTYYGSSNGGASEDAVDVWGGNTPFTKSVDDPWSADPNVNPLATWTVKVSDGDMAAYFGWDRATDAVITRGPPGTLVKFIGVKNGTEVSATLSGWQIVSLLRAHGFGYHAPGSPTSTRIRVSPYIAAVIDPPGFDDTAGHLFEADIDWAAEVGITKGCNPPANTKFCPNDPVSREVMAAFINRYLDLPPASKDYFSDDNDSIFHDDINRLAEAGITKGCNPPANTLFCPKNTVDRGQMAAFLVRAFGLTDDGGGDLFVDDDNSIFEGDIDKLATAGITKGCNPPTNNWYCPNLAVDRGAMTAFLHRSPGP